MLNETLPYVMDDIPYTYIFQETYDDNIGWLDIHKKIHSYADVIQSQWNHYFINNGRVLVHCVVQCFCGIWGKGVYNVCTTIIFALFCFLMGRLSFGNRMPFFRSGLIALASFYLLAPEPSCLFNGMAYGINYLWSSVYCLLFLYLLWNTSTIQSSAIPLFVVALLAGCSHEGLAVGVGGGLLAWIVLMRFRATRIQWFAMIIFLLGACLLIFAPSNFVRASKMNEAFGTEGKLMLHLRMFLFMRATYIFLMACFLFAIINRDKFRLYFRENIVWIFAWLSAFLFILVIGTMNPRATYGFDLIAVILLLRMLPFINLFYPHSERIAIWASVILVAGGLYILEYQLRSGRQYHRIDKVLSSSKEQDCLILLQDAHIPFGILPYISHYKFEEPWESAWWDRIYAWQYEKKRILVAKVNAKDDAQRLEDCFSSDRYKVAGDNPFYLIGNYLFTERYVDRTVKVELVLGDYHVHGVRSFLRWLWSKASPIEKETIVTEFSFSNFYFQNKKYQCITLPVNHSREIESINLVK